MDLMQIGTQLLKNKLGNSGNSDSIAGALEGLLGGTGGNLDIGSLVSTMMNKGNLQGIVGSWLGDGDNEAISGDQIEEVVGTEKIAEFASQLGVDKGTAAQGLAESIPQMVDKGSSGGSLLDAVGGISGVADIAKKLF